MFPAVLKLCGESLHQLWVVKIALTRLSPQRSREFARTQTAGASANGLSAAGDNPASWIGFSEQIEEWAREHGCAAMRSFAPRHGACLA